MIFFVKIEQEKSTLFYEKSWIEQVYIRKQSSQSNCQIGMKFCMKSINMFSLLWLNISSQSEFGKD
jgi:hypothetical protein